MSHCGLNTKTDVLTQPLRFISDSSSCDRETLGRTTHLSDEW